MVHHRKESLERFNIQRDGKKTIWVGGYFPLPQILLLLHQTKLTTCIEFPKNLNGSIIM